MRIVTPGTVTDEALLSERVDNLIACRYLPPQWQVWLRDALDITSDRFQLRVS
ncbi:hypothetical protein OK016_06170 [Vibrio chagasii]|nr:hypothetical protein [Vibrio chagasii]